MDCARHAFVPSGKREGLALWDSPRKAMSASTAMVPVSTILPKISAVWSQLLTFTATNRNAASMIWNQSHNSLSDDRFTITERPLTLAGFQ
jgi:hypothetical protein